MRVNAHMNLHTKKFSVVDPKTGRVIDSADTVVLRNVEFRVRKAGLERVREEGVRNVHAYVTGQRVDPKTFAAHDAGGWYRFRYNPFKFDTFVIADSERPVHRAEYVILDTKKGTWLMLHPEDERLGARKNPRLRRQAEVRNECRLWNG